MRKLIYISVLLFITVALSAQVYYVSPRGSESNTGLDSSSTGAFLQVQTGFDAVEAGDTLYLMGGTHYTEGSVIMSNSGTEGNWIYILGYPDKDVIINCENN